MNAQAQGIATAVPNSAGTLPPVTPVPVLACDAHIHVYDPRFTEVKGPSLTATPQHASATDFQLLQRRLGTQRVVIVTPRVYGTDNAVTLDAIARLGAERARGVAVVAPDIPDADLRRLHEGGIRGVRFTLHAATGAPMRFDMLEAVARRIADFGWHLQLHCTASQYLAHADLLGRLPVPLVFDHLGRIPLAQGPDHPTFRWIAGLLQDGKAWLKLSGAYLNSASGPPYDDTLPIARAWAGLAPERLVWGSDWPHATEAQEKPDDARLFDLLARWVPDAQVRQRILVDNPAALYQF